MPNGWCLEGPRPVARRARRSWRRTPELVRAGARALGGAGVCPTGPKAADTRAKNGYSYRQWYPTFRRFLRDEVGPRAYVPEYGERFFWPVFLAGVP